jgi:Resolvase, N terminal domain
LDHAPTIGHITMCSLHVLDIGHHDLGLLRPRGARSGACRPSGLVRRAVQRLPGCGPGPGANTGPSCDALTARKLLNIPFVSLSDNLDLSTASGRLMFNIIDAMAAFEPELIRERVRGHEKRQIHRSPLELLVASRKRPGYARPRELRWAAKSSVPDFACLFASSLRTSGHDKSRAGLPPEMHRLGSNHRAGAVPLGEHAERRAFKNFPVLLRESIYSGRKRRRRTSAGISWRD